MTNLKISNSEIEKRYRASLANLDRAPFVEQAAKFLAHQPTDSKLKAWANKYPDRWAQAIATFARLSGYADKIETSSTSLHIAINAMSDGDLIESLEKISAQLDQTRAPATINITPRTDNPPTDNQSKE